jgi:hypothetical protein
MNAGILALQNKVLPKSTAGKAANYTLSRWSGLTLFLKYPELELSTNFSENSMRGIAIGRNYVHSRIMYSDTARKRLNFRIGGTFPQVAALDRCA